MYFLTAIWSLLLLLMGLKVTGLFPFYSYYGSFYWFTVPFLFHAIFCFLMSAYCLFRPNAELKKIIRWGVMLFPLSWFFAMIQWPGGDDGPGMAWLFYVGGPSLLSMAGSLMSRFFNKQLAK
jgi:hypothetical protein